MREFKFRAWHDGGKNPEEAEMIYDNPHHVFKWLYEGQPVTVMQFTGLKDKKGNDVYIGDVFSKNSHNWVVVDCFEFGSVKMNRVGGKGTSSNPRLTRWQAETSVVVGNIYENTELLKSRN